MNKDCGFFCSGSGARTHDTSVNSRLLCQLSYPRKTRYACTESTRTLSTIPVTLDLVEPGIPPYQRVAEEALRLRKLGWSFNKIAPVLGVTGRTVKRAVDWELELKPSGASETSKQILSGARGKSRLFSQRAKKLREAGATYQEIADRLGVSLPTARRAALFAGAESPTPEHLQDRIRADVKRLRQKGWTQKQIATELGVSCGTVQNAIKRIRQNDEDH